MSYLVECLDGPVRERISSGQIVLAEIKPSFNIQLADGRWVYYYQTFVASHPFPLETTGSTAKKKQAKKNLPQAIYKYCKVFGAVTEDHPDIQVYLSSYASRFQTRPLQLT